MGEAIELGNASGASHALKHLDLPTAIAVPNSALEQAFRALPDRPVDGA
ncbi:hypothetical protein [Mesorhizobium sp. M4A.F.Ca.ET.050.02.1.1]|nr:hypothetical protein [Mesorhizobium sp. M4A.F.Ca.ET.050.02.1.1]